MAGTKLVQEMNLEKSLEGLLLHSASGLRPPPRFLQHVHHEPSLLREKVSLVKEKNTSLEIRDVVLSTLAA